MMPEKFNFSVALEKAKDNYRICRSGWNGKGMYVFLVPSNNWTLGTGENSPPLLPFLAMKTATGHVVPWLISQTDALADDWEVST